MCNLFFFFLFVTSSKKKSYIFSILCTMRCQHSFHVPNFMTRGALEAEKQKYPPPPNDPKRHLKYVGNDLNIWEMA